MNSWKRHWRNTPRAARRMIVLIVGFICIVAGAVMLIIPGPGWATIFLGLAILATEFERAEQVRARLSHHVRSAVRRVQSRHKH